MKLFRDGRRQRLASGGTCRLATLSLAACLMLTACEPGSGLAPFPQTASGPYQLGPGEKVRVVVFGQEHLTGEFRVNDHGAISIPLLGAIPADGMTTTQLEQSISAELRQKKVLLEPSVSVEIIDYRQVFILGEVVKPGQYPYEPGMTVLTAVAVAGGFTYRARTGFASILRRLDGHAVEGRVGRGHDVLPGDVITVFQRYF